MKDHERGREGGGGVCASLSLFAMMVWWNDQRRKDGRVNRNQGVSPLLAAPVELFFDKHSMMLDSLSPREREREREEPTAGPEKTMCLAENDPGSDIRSITQNAGEGEKREK
ncbi:hypothetical protein CISG_09418 [Coccidioides immitis RMSCC 3703]|uniref:Uncharacterized protein n=2 Tax=Coccidioides immitis TaxID=5501 RepID=A0A0J8RAS7_COCIT|nr:hypothetical protein CIRG_04223 [Coccidioides immitis RMSCC 2394]KMU81956.1 hypothetical protein CISG_09418 [Coccidioides immitis RMSCC 3703]